MNHLHRDLNELKPLLNLSAPVHLLYFKAATEKLPDIWTSAIHIRQMLERDGHREHYILTVTASVNSLLDTLHMCDHGGLHRTQFVSPKQTTNRQYTLDVVQEGLVHLLEFCLHQRCPHYDAMNAGVHTFGETDSDDDLPADINMNDDILEHMVVQQEIAEENAAFGDDRDQPVQHGILPEHQDTLSSNEQLALAKLISYMPVLTNA